MNPPLCDAGSRNHKISSTFLKVIGDWGWGGGGGGGTLPPPLFTVKLCVMINFSLRHNVLCKLAFCRSFVLHA